MSRLRLRRLANLLNGSTPAGLALARAGGARVSDGPHGLRLAAGYRAWFPAPRAPAVTVGDVVLLRMPLDAALRRPALLRHEAVHAAQWAWFLGPVGFLPAYGLAAAWSWLRLRDAALANWFEVRAGLEEGGYVRPGSRPRARPSGPRRRTPR
ncbi:MAG: hypothetical protein ACLGIV_14665 [Actinomycetes bacterium]